MNGQKVPASYPIVSFVRILPIAEAIAWLELESNGQGHRRISLLTLASQLARRIRVIASSQYGIVGVASTDGTMHLVAWNVEFHKGFVVAPPTASVQGKGKPSFSLTDYCRAFIREMTSIVVDFETITDTLNAARVRAFYEGAEALPYTPENDQTVARLNGKPGICEFDPQQALELQDDPSNSPQTIVDHLTTIWEQSESLTSYRSAHALPEMNSVKRLIEEAMQLLFPGIYGKRINDIDFKESLERQIVVFKNHVAELVLQALQYDSADQGDSHLWSNEIASNLICKLPKIVELLECDLQAAYEKDPALEGSPHEIVLCYPFVRAIASHRIAHELYRDRIPFIPRMMSECVHQETGIDIHPGAEIGRGFFIDHGTGVVIGGTAIIGDYVTIYQGVTLGSLNFPKDKDGKIIRGARRHPKIEDHVTIYANASILGGSTVIGRNSDVGACVTLTRSIPPETVIVREAQQLRSRSKVAAIRTKADKTPHEGDFWIGGSLSELQTPSTRAASETKKASS